MSAPTKVGLRYYQKDAADAFEKYLKDNKTGNGILELPTGAGKSYLLAELIRRFAGIRNARMLIVSHTKNIIQQDYDSTCKLWPEGKSLFGINSEGLGRRNTKNKVLFCGIQSVFNKVDEIVGDVDDDNYDPINVLIVDESHRVNLTTSVQYKTFIKDLLKKNPKMRSVGLDASPFRDIGLVYGPSKDLLFDDLVYKANVKELIAQGYLAKPITPTVSKESRIDTAGVRVSKSGRKDYIDSELNDRANISSLIKAQVKEILDGSAGLNSIAAFAVNIDHAENIAQEFINQGEDSVAVVHSKIKGDDKTLIDDFKAIKTRVLVSVNMFVEGFDAPNIQVIMDCKPTKSPGRYVQMYGRGFRLCDEIGKTTFIVFDFAGNVAEHGPVDQVKPKSATDKDGVAPKKQCGNPLCNMMCHARMRQCPHCGYLFPPPIMNEPEDRTSSKSGNQSIISEPKWFNVKQLKCLPSKNKAAISAHYYCEGGKFRIDVLWEGKGWSEQGSNWLENHLDNKMPFDVTNFFKGAYRSQLIMPKRIFVDEAGLSSKILEYEF
jgi:DNA repair protein RadD